MSAVYCLAPSLLSFSSFDKYYTGGELKGLAVKLDLSLDTAPIVNVCLAASRTFGLAHV